MSNRTLRHARAQLSLAAEHVADATTERARMRAHRRQRAARRSMVEALRLADAWEA